MREILFRGKWMRNDKWVEGFYARLHDGKGNISHRIYSGYAESDCGDFYPEWFEIDPSTVGQYTGLTDKNGKKIFEGDIVQFRTRSSTFNPLYVRWYEETAQFIVTETNCVRSYPMDRSWEYEILGNFYDNIDILREAANE